VNTRIVASCCLKRWRELYTVHIPWFNLCLKQKVENAVELFANDAKVSDFGLVDDWLPPPEDPILILVNIYPDNRKELPRLMTEIPRSLVKVPSLQFSERHLGDIHLHFTIPPFNPRENLFRGVERIILRQQ
jgi:hypothetical protein